MDTQSKRPKRAAAAFSAARIFNTDSPITKQHCDIQTFLSICLLNWAGYDEDEKQLVISMLPPAYQTYQVGSDGYLVCPVAPDWMADDRVIRDHIARFRRDVADGFYTKTWQEKAQQAGEDRKRGKFDAYLTKHAAEMFAESDDDLAQPENQFHGGAETNTINITGKELRKRNQKRNQDFPDELYHAGTSDMTGT